MRNAPNTNLCITELTSCSRWPCAMNEWMNGFLFLTASAQYLSVRKGVSHGRDMEPKIITLTPRNMTASKTICADENPSQRACECVELFVWFIKCRIRRHPNESRAIFRFNWNFTKKCVPSVFAGSVWISRGLAAWHSCNNTCNNNKLNTAREYYLADGRVPIFIWKSIRKSLNGRP